MKEAIKINNLTKSYGTHVVLNGLDFCVQQGEIFALLGINGAGKTTSLECIEGLRKYDSGSIAINGRMGIQLQSASLPQHIRALEAVKLFAKWNKTALDQTMLDALGIYELAQKQYYQLSTGQKRRLHLALALTRDPDILFLDEPTAGLDVEGQLSLLTARVLTFESLLPLLLIFVLSIVLCSILLRRIDRQQGVLPRSQMA